MSPDRKAEILEQFFSLRPPDEGRQLVKGGGSPATPSKLEGMTISEFARASIVSQAFTEELTLALLALLPLEQQAPLLDRVAQQVKARIEEPFNSPEAQAIVDQMRARAIARLG
jgi:Mg/Co/Ni transporter MgtE